jgi:hypothetical protein
MIESHYNSQSRIFASQETSEFQKEVTSENVALKELIIN